MATAIKLEGVSKRFADKAALDGLDMTLASGRINGLVGPDGAGKTTLLRLMAALMLPTTGSVRVASFDTRAQAASVHAVAGYMPQRFGLYEDLSVIENLRLYAALRSVDRSGSDARFERLLEFTRLGAFRSRLAGRLSGGMKQKLGLACALIGEPEVLLLDEPSVGVDPVSRKELWQIVGELAATGMTIVWSTAYLDEAERCDEVWLLDDGRIAFAGAPETLAGRLEGRSFELRHLAGNRRSILAEALELPSVGDGVIQGAAVRVVLRAGAEREPLEALAKGHAGELAPVAPRFEDAFIDLLGGGPGGRSKIAEQMPPSLLESDVAVRCAALTKRFGSFVAADHVTFDVNPGEIFGLLGPNGAGKSTTFKMLCGLLKPTSGIAEVAGHDLRKSPSRAKLRLGYMAQKFSLYGLLSVRQNLEFFSGVYGLAGRQRRERIDGMIETFELGRYIDDSPNELPLGYKQRLALACALMHNPDVLFLDEPTSGVDPMTRREFWTHINGLVRKGVTVLVTTHFMDEAEYCDRVALMHQSRVIALDTPDALKARATGDAAASSTMEEAFIALIEAAEQSARVAA